MSDSVFDFTKAHEQVVLTLRFEKPLSCMAVSNHLDTLGVVWDDDFGYMPRQDKIEPWQGTDICQVEFLELEFLPRYSGFPTQCRGLIFQFLFSALPPSSQTVFLHLLEKAKSSFSGQIEHLGNTLSIEQVRDLFQQFTLDLQEEFAESAGSEFLQRLILEFRYNQKAF